MSKTLGQPVVVENKPGGGTTLAANVLVGAKPDGYTMLQTSLAMALADKIIGEQTWDYTTDFKSVGPLGISDFLLIVPADSEIKTYENLIERGRAGSLNYSSSGIGAPSHLMMEELAGKIGIEVNHIGYEGAGPAFNALLAGEVDVNFSVTMTAVPMIRDGRVRAIGVSTLNRSPLAPDVPTLDELGATGFEGVAWYGVVVPKDTPDTIVTKLNSALNAALLDEGVKSRLEPMGMTLETGSPQDLEAFSRGEIERWSKVVSEVAD